MRRLLKEDPDCAYSCETKEKGLPRWHNDDGEAFIYDTNLRLLMVGPRQSVHNYFYYPNNIKDCLSNIGYDDEEMAEYCDQVQKVGRNGGRFIQGRIWLDKEVISFWTMPTFPQLKDIVAQFKKEGTDISNYRIDLGANGAPILQNYINKNTQQNTNFDTTVIHTLPPEEKHNSQQLTAARNTMSAKKAQKLGGMPEAKYNFYRRYGMGDSVNRRGNSLQESYLPEVEADDINLSSFKPQDELNPKFWINGKLNSNVRLKLLDIADSFLDEIAVNWVKPEDIVLTGSIANYNWSKYSDVDLHILIDYKKVWEKTEFVEDYFDSKKEIWASEHPNLKIYGFPVEVYVEDANGENNSSGIYSIKTNKWIKEPIDFEDSELNEPYIRTYAARILTKIDNIFDKMQGERNAKKLEDYSLELRKIFDKLKNIRKEGLKKGGEMSSGNIIWKICRRLGYLEKLWDFINATFDKINSLR